MIGNDQRAVWSWRPQARSPPISCSITSLCSASAAAPAPLGFRVYYLQRGTTLIILLAGGGKSSQAKDIDEALLLADNLTEQT